MSTAANNVAYEEVALSQEGQIARRAAQLEECDQLEDSKPRHECGVFGTWSSQKNASRVTFFALYALNHRGQESAGIASFDSGGIIVHKGMGLVSQVFTESDIDNLRGSSAIGHTRYSTAGGSKLVAAQPFVLETDLGQLAIAHNGQVARAALMRQKVLHSGVGLFTNSDSEVIAQMLARPHDTALASALLKEDRRKKSFDESRSSSMSTPPRAHSAPVTATSDIPSPQPSAMSTSLTAALAALQRTDDSTDSCAPSVEAIAAALSNGASVFGQRDPVWPAWVARIAAFMKDCAGAYSFVALTRDAVYGVRDPVGLRPLCIGQKVESDGSRSYHLASESCALATIGADFVREVDPGEIVRLDGEGISSFTPFGPARARPSAFCVFEYVYFARPDSILEGQMVHNVRTRLGARLAIEAPADVDIVSGVPDSSIAAAIGFATSAGLPFTEVFCKNRYIARTFIKPDDTLRKNAIQLKYNPLTHVLKGKRVLLVDDSLVRGNTLAQLVPLLRKGGATEVHIRISSPPIRHPCYYGVDIGSKKELIAYNIPDVEKIRQHIGADTLAYLSHDGMMAAVNEGCAPRYRGMSAPGNDNQCESSTSSDGHCSACFTGSYPIPYDF